MVPAAGGRCCERWHPKRIRHCSGGPRRRARLVRRAAPTPQQHSVLLVSACARVQFSGCSASAQLFPLCVRRLRCPLCAPIGCAARARCSCTAGCTTLSAPAPFAANPRPCKGKQSFFRKQWPCTCGCRWRSFVKKRKMLSSAMK
eukprot:1178445-Prymnesium_polylepis.2